MLKCFLKYHLMEYQELTFNENIGSLFGGAMYITQHCGCYFNGNTSVIFSENHGLMVVQK